MYVDQLVVLDLKVGDHQSKVQKKGNPTIPLAGILSHYNQFLCLCLSKGIVEIATNPLGSNKVPGKNNIHLAQNKETKINIYLQWEWSL